MLALLLAPSFPVSVPLFLIGRLAETPDACAIWPQQSQEGRCLTAPKERETLELTWLLSTNIVFINGGQNALALPHTIIGKRTGCLFAALVKHYIIMMCRSETSVALLLYLGMQY